MALCYYYDNFCFSTVPLSEHPYAVVEKVVELFYYGEIGVTTQLKPKVLKALAALQVEVSVDLPIARAVAKQRSSINDIQIESVQKNGMDFVCGVYSSRLFPSIQCIFLSIYS